MVYQNLSEADFAAALKSVGLPTGLADMLASADPAVVPRLDHALPLQHGELLFELVAKRLVSVGVGEEDVGHRYLSGCGI